MIFAGGQRVGFTKYYATEKKFRRDLDALQGRVLH